jgi:surface-anchored protein
MSHRMIRTATSLLVLTFMFGGVSPVKAQTPEYTSGHADIGFGDEATIEPHVHAHGGAVVDGTPLGADAEYAPGGVVIVVPDSTRTSRAAGGAWDPIGVNAGEDYWYLPASGTVADNLNAPFLGLGTEHIDSGVFDGDVLSMTLTAMNGPTGGEFSLWYESGGPQFEMSTADGISSADQVTDFAVGAHDHRAWGFTKPGDYSLTFEISGTQSSVPVTESGAFQFTVVPEPSAFLLLGIGGFFALVSGRRRRR